MLLMFNTLTRVTLIKKGEALGILKVCLNCNFLLRAIFLKNVSLKKINMKLHCVKYVEGCAKLMW